MIAYFFPPIRGGGVQRTVKFAKYLPQFGWQPAVLTVGQNRYKTARQVDLDWELLDDLPNEVQIYRTSSVDFLFRGKIGRLIHYLMQTLFVPDDQMLSWLPFALKKAINIMHEDNIQAIYSTSTPYANHFIGCFLRKVTGVPWVADFRDPWTTNPNYRSLSPIHTKAKRFFESRIYRDCDVIISSTEGYKQDLLNNFPFVRPAKVKVITNGYDPEDFLGSPINCNGELFSMTYLAGSSYGDYFLGCFLKGLRTLLEQEPNLSSKIRVNLVGEDPKGVRMVRRLGFPNDMVHFVQYVPQKHIGRLLSSSDLLLLLLPPQARWKNCIPQKTFQYLRAGKPILAVVPEGSTAELIRATKTGMVITLGDCNKIAETIYELFKRKETGELKYTPDFAMIRKFARERLTEQLSDILNRLVQKGS